MSWQVGKRCHITNAVKMRLNVCDGHPREDIEVLFVSPPKPAYLHVGMYAYYIKPLKSVSALEYEKYRMPAIPVNTVCPCAGNVQ